MLKLQNVQSKTTFYSVFHFQEAIKCGREQECDNGLYCVREWRFRNQNKVENQLDLNRKISRHVPKIKPPPKIGKSRLEKYKTQSVCEKNERQKKGLKMSKSLTLLFLLPESSKDQQLWSKVS